MKIQNYKVGLVLSQAGLNSAQLVEVRSRLKFIAQLGGAEPDGITITVPSLHHAGPAGARDVEMLVTALARIEYARVVIVESVCAIADCIQLFMDHDEVWCIPALRQTLSTKARAWMIYDQAGRDPTQKRKYQIIPPWVEAPVAEAKDRKPKAMKG